MLLFLIFLISLNAQIIKAKYDVAYGLFGKVGNSEAILIKDEKKYKIIVVAEATGFAKILSKNRKEIYISEGVVKDGVLIPVIFKKTRKSLTKKDIKIYRFDHDKKKVYLHVERYKKNKLDRKKDEVLNFYAKDDILSLYFNIKKYVNFKRSGKKIYDFFAVGGRKKDGLVKVELAVGHTLERLKKLLKTEGVYFIVTIYQKIFASKEGKLYIVMNDEGIAKKALLKDVILFGDIRGKLTDLEVRK